jgi:hypothetical protein
MISLDLDMTLMLGLQVSTSPQIRGSTCVEGSQATAASTEHILLACATAPPPTHRPGATSEHAFSKAANFWRRAPTSLGGPESSRGSA